MVSQQVTAGTDWVVSITAKAANGVVQGTARLLGSPGASMTVVTGGVGTAVSPGDIITIASMGWTKGSGVAPATSMATRAAFRRWVRRGRNVRLRPGTLTLNPPATLELTYTDEAAPSIDESKLRMYR